MNTVRRVTCPACKANQLTLKYEATYEYSYRIDADAPGTNNSKMLLPYLYDNRKQMEAIQYIECRTCGAKYPCYFDRWTEGIDSEAIQEALDSAYAELSGTT